MRQSLVSVIVTTRNNHETLNKCLKSITQQSYKDIELIVVDNNSTDDTKVIARRHSKRVFNIGPERSAQRNFGVREAEGAYVLIIDSDMELTENVVQSCVKKVQIEPATKALIIPEESFGEGFWAQCKRLERSFYVGVDAIEAARFFDKKLFELVGGYNELMTGGEDWDLTHRMRILTNVDRVDPFIRHNEGKLGFLRTSKKMYYYAQHATSYFTQNPDRSAFTDQSGPLARYKLFFSQPTKLFKNPILGLGMITLKTFEYASGGLGYLKSSRARRAYETN